MSVFRFSFFSKIDSSVGCQLLASLLGFGSDLVDSLSVKTQSETFTVFDHFFNSLVLLAGTNKENGHLILIKAVETWLPTCIRLVKEAEAVIKDEGMSEDDAKQLRSQATLPVASLFLYISNLSSAVQFVTNMVMCTEKRNMAGEHDSFLQDSDSEDETGKGGVELEEESGGEESVSVHVHGSIIV